jgi:hypothetical protein
MLSLNPMSTFDPFQLCQVHDRLNDRMIEWRTGWAYKYRQQAVVDKVDGTVGFDGLVLDGWTASATSH